MTVFFVASAAEVSGAEFTIPAATATMLVAHFPSGGLPKNTDAMLLDFKTDTGDFTLGIRRFDNVSGLAQVIPALANPATYRFRKFITSIPMGMVGT